MKRYNPTLLKEEDNAYPDLFKRSPYNPIITAKDLPYPVHTIFNPAATMYEGKTLLLARAEDRQGFSHLARATSEDGITEWTFDKKPSIVAEPDLFPEETWGIEDPRITYMEDTKNWIIAYTSFSRKGPTVSIAFTEDFVKFDKQGAIMPPDDKDAALFPKKINGKYYLIHRPYSDGHKAHIWLSSSLDLKNWGENQILLNARNGGWWDANKIGISAQPLQTEEGWLILYHGVKSTASGAIYRLGLALLDIDNPFIVLKRSNDWIFEPEYDYERFGDVNNVVFPCGWILDEETGMVRMYYGGADTSIDLATAKLEDLLNYIRKCPKPIEDD